MTTTLENVQNVRSLPPPPREEDYNINYSFMGWQDSREALEYYYDTKAYDRTQKMVAAGQSWAEIARTLLEWAKDYNRTGYGIAGDCYERAANAVLKLSRPRRRKRH